MHLPAWIPLALPVVLLGVLFTWRAVKLRRERRAAPPPRHRPSAGRMEQPDQAALILIGKVGADGANLK